MITAQVICNMMKNITQPLSLKSKVRYFLNMNISNQKIKIDYDSRDQIKIRLYQTSVSYPIGDYLRR